MSASRTSDKKASIWNPNGPKVFRTDILSMNVRKTPENSTIRSRRSYITALPQHRGSVIRRPLATKRRVGRDIEPVSRYGLPGGAVRFAVNPEVLKAAAAFALVDAVLKVASAV